MLYGLQVQCPKPIFAPMQRLNFPTCGFRFKNSENKMAIFDRVRKKFVILTPEEWVRQNFVQYLIQDRGYSRGLIRIEHGFSFRGALQRADVVAHDRNGGPLLVAECKAPDVAVSQRAFDQIARYNTVLGCRLLVVTNGLKHYCCEVDRESQSLIFLPDVPQFEATSRSHDSD